MDETPRQFTAVFFIFFQVGYTSPEPEAVLLMTTVAPCASLDSRGSHGSPGTTVDEKLKQNWNGEGSSSWALSDTNHTMAARFLPLRS